MSEQTAKRPFPVKHGHARPGRSNTNVKVNGESERWLVAARLSRVSKKDRERGDEVINGIQTQDLRSAEWAQHEGHKIVHVTKDRNVSGAIAPWERPELGPWLTDPVKMVQYDGVVAYDAARISREYFDLAWIRKWAELNNKKLYVIKERLRWPDNRDGTLWGVAAERAYEERQDIIERTTRELGALREAGKFIGRPPFGFTSAGEKYDHYLAPTDEGRKYVPLVYQHCIEGWSLIDIMEWLIAEGVTPVSGGWGPSSVAGLIKNPVYMGHRCEREAIPPDEVEDRDGRVIRYRYGNAWAETPRWQYGRTVHRCEPLVDAAIWKRANEALATRAKRGHSDPGERAMLSEALSCPSCEDSPMYRHRATGRGRPYHYYRCQGRGRNRSSCGLMVRVELVDAAVNAIMASTFDVPVMRHEIVYGNEAVIEAEIERIKFELKQLAARELGWEEEDSERARLRAEHERVSNTKLIEDRVELVETDDTYLELWERLGDPERGPWLAEHGFQITASKKLVIVARGEIEGQAGLDEPERLTTIRVTEPVYQGKCECGCGTDVYGSSYGTRKKFVDQAHARKAAQLRRRTRER
jgi:site-specific DNA recombinase